MNRQSLVRKDKRYLWHPFTQQQEWEWDQDIAIITKGKGTYLYDSKGKKYLDGVSSLWCNVHGHQVSEIDRARKKRVRPPLTIIFLSKMGTRRGQRGLKM
jgi:adenosylmethionine---8-amino-7-oxononanoate aminotransferase